jgi:hypothetical protein
MTLELVNLRGENTDPRLWIPFTSSVGYENPHWWNSADGTIGAPWFIQVLEAGIEVARVQLDDAQCINPEYTGVPTIGDEQLEIQLIEVATAARDRKVGTRVVHALAERHPDRRLLAYSEGADRFWARQGWARFDHPSGGYKPLFIQPAD